MDMLSGRFNRSGVDSLNWCFLGIGGTRLGGARPVFSGGQPFYIYLMKVKGEVK